MHEYNCTGREVVKNALVAGLELMQFTENMTDQDWAASKLFDSTDREPCKAIVVAFDSEDRRDLFQLVDDFEFSDVAGVDDCIDAIEDRAYSRIEETMCIRDNANSHAGIILSVRRRHENQLERVRKNADESGSNSSATTEFRSLSRRGFATD